MILADWRETETATGRTVVDDLGRPELIQLDHGDYLLRGHGLTALIERMTPGDLLDGLVSGRTTRKLQGMAEDADLVFVIQEGWIGRSKDNFCRLPDWGERRIRYDAFRLYQLSASIHWVHYWEVTHSPQETASTLKLWHEWLVKPDHNLPNQRYRPFDLSRGRDPGREILQGFRGIGPKHTAEILSRFGGLPLDWTASEEELSGVVGKALARKLVQFIHESGRKKK